MHHRCPLRGKKKKDSSRGMPHEATTQRYCTRLLLTCSHAYRDSHTVASRTAGRSQMKSGNYLWPCHVTTVAVSRRHVVAHDRARGYGYGLPELTTEDPFGSHELKQKTKACLGTGSHSENLDYGIFERSTQILPKISWCCLDTYYQNLDYSLTSGPQCILKYSSTYPPK